MRSVHNKNQGKNTAPNKAPTLAFAPILENGAEVGTTKQHRALDAIKIELIDPPGGVRLRYQVHVEGEGWMEWVSEGEIAGTIRQGRRMEAIRIELIQK